LRPAGSATVRRPATRGRRARPPPDAAGVPEHGGRSARGSREQIVTCQRPSRHDPRLRANRPAIRTRAPATRTSETADSFLEPLVVPPAGPFPEPSEGAFDVGRGGSALAGTGTCQSAWFVPSELTSSERPSAVKVMPSPCFCPGIDTSAIFLPGAL